MVLMVYGLNATFGPGTSKDRHVSRLGLSGAAARVHYHAEPTELLQAEFWCHEMHGSHEARGGQLARLVRAARWGSRVR